MSEGFPEDVRQFIADHIDSVAELEVLLLLKSDPQRAWCAEEIGKVLYTTPEMVATQLGDLRSRGLLAVVDGASQRYQYQINDERLDELVNRLDEIYQQRRVSVITLIYSKPIDKVRTFADAFRLWREK